MALISGGTSGILKALQFDLSVQYNRLVLIISGVYCISVRITVNRIHIQCILLII